MSHNYDWPYIRMRYEAGETAYTISQMMGGKPSKQAIAKRAAKEGWEQSESSSLAVARQLPSVKRALGVTQSKRTPETVAAIAELLSEGATLEIAARSCGVHPETLSDWRRDDPQLRLFLDRARAGSLAECELVIHEAARKGDWKAAMAKLGSAPETREHYGKHEQGSRLEVVINIDRPPVEGVTVEG